MDNSYYCKCGTILKDARDKCYSCGHQSPSVSASDTAHLRNPPKDNDIIIMIEIITKDGTKGKPFTITLDDLVRMIKMATPMRASFEIQRVI